MILRKLSKGDDPAMIPLNRADFNIHVTGLPFGFLKHQIAEYIGNAVGSFIDFDEEAHQNSMGSTMRVRVSIDITKP